MKTRATNHRAEPRLAGRLGHFLGLFIVAVQAASGSEVPPEKRPAPECASEAGMAIIPAGTFEPMFAGKNSPKQINVKSFCLDRYPVSNADYLEFVKANPKWQRSAVKSLFADALYLQHWAGDLELGPEAPGDAPVTSVSWFAAKAYASWRGKRLPTTAEWELAAAASPSRSDGKNDPAFTRKVLEWYGSPAPKEVQRIGQGVPNYYGIHDLHGLVWEWVADFNNALVSGDSRENSSRDRDLFCGGAAQGARDLKDYPAFTRIGFRSSLKADYCVPNLGFRCAKDLDPKRYRY